MARGTVITYGDLKQHLPAPACRVLEELVEAGLGPEAVLCRLVHDEGCDIHQAYGYVREVLWRSLMEMTGAPVVMSLSLIRDDEQPTPVAAA